MLYDFHKQSLSIRYQGTYKHFIFCNKSTFLISNIAIHKCSFFAFKTYTDISFTKKTYNYILNSYYSLYLLYYSLYKLFLKNLNKKVYFHKFTFEDNTIRCLYKYNLYTLYSYKYKFIGINVRFLQKYLFYIYNIHIFFLNKNLYTYNNIYNILNVILQHRNSLHLFYLNFFRKVKNFFFKSFRIYLKHRWNPRWYVRKRKVILNRHSLIIPKKFIKKNKKINMKAVYKHYTDEAKEYSDEYQRSIFLKNFFKFYSLQRFRKPLKFRPYLTLVKPYDNIEVNNFRKPLIMFSPSLTRPLNSSKYIYCHILLDSLTVVNNRFFKKYKKRRLFRLTKKRRNLSIRKTARIYTKPIRIVGKFFRRLYNRSFHNFNFKKIFKNIFLFPSTRVSFYDFYWINPVYDIKRSMKRINKLKNTISIRHKYRSYNINKYNNFFPMFAVKRKYFLRYYKPNTKLSTPTYSSYFLYYYLFFLENLCNQKIWFKVNASFCVPTLVKQYINSSLFSKNKSRLGFGKGFFIKEMYEILWLSIAYRDLSLYSSWFKKSMERLHYKKHRRMIKFLYDTIRNNQKVYLHFSNIKGISCDVRGKLGATGNAKKRHLAFTVGKISITEKKSPLYCYSNIIKTPTGVLGFTFLLMV